VESAGVSSLFMCATPPLPMVANDLPARVGNGLPEPASYPRSCGALCTGANTHRALQFHSSVRSGLLALARAHSVGKQLAFVARADLVVAGELFEGDLLHTVLFFCITTGQGRRGRFPDTAMFGRLMVQSGSSASPYQGVRLRHRRRAFLPPSSAVPVYPPLSLATEGPLQLVTEEDMAHDLCFLDVHPAGLVDRLVLRALDWRPEPGRGDGYDIQGLQDLEPLCILAGTEGKPLRGGNGDVVDFLDDLSRPAASRRGARQQQQQPHRQQTFLDLTEETSMMRDVLLANGAVEEQFARTLHDMEEELERAMEEEIQAVVGGDEEQVEVEEDHSGIISAPVSKTEADGGPSRRLWQRCLWWLIGS